MIENILVSVNDLGRLFEVTVRTIWKWNERGMPKEARGKFSLLKCVRWWRANILGDIQGETNLAEQKLRFAVARARREELRVSETEGKLINGEQPLSWLRGHVTEAKEAFWTLPRRMAESLACETDSKMIEVALQDEVRRILTDLADGKVKIEG
jgi:phage terminase Nu1 subunit (DNA packaging protein)